MKIKFLKKSNQQVDQLSLVPRTQFRLFDLPGSEINHQLTFFHSWFILGLFQTAIYSPKNKKITHLRIVTPELESLLRKPSSTSKVSGV